MLTNIEVVKKDGRVEPFRMTKLLTALQAAASDIHYTLTDDELKQIENEVYKYIEAQSVLLPQDLHFTAIEAARKVNADVAKAYEDYHKQKQSLKVSDLNRLKVVSKTGIVSDFNAKYIEDACQKAAKSIGKELTEEQLHDVLSEGL